MIVCAKCGNANESRDEFCGSCGAFLEWHGERIAEAPAPVPEPVVAPPVEKPGLIDRVRYVVKLDDQLAGQAPPPVIQAGGLGGQPLPPPPTRETPSAMGPPTDQQLRPPPPPPPVTDAGLPPQAPTYPPRNAASGTEQVLAPPQPPPGLGSSIPMQPPRYAPPPQPHGGSQPPQPPLYGGSQPPPPLADPNMNARPPGQEFERPNAQRPKATDLGPADLYCGSCGSGNTADRRFCRKCGYSLADAVVARRSWWSRTFGGSGGQAAPSSKRGLEVGERPRNWKKLSVPDKDQAMGGGGASKPRRKFRMPKLPDRLPIGRPLGFVLLGLGLVGFGVPAARSAVTEWGFNTFHAVKRVVAPDHAIVTAKSITANTAAKTNPASFAIDRNPDTYWSDGLANAGVGAELTVQLAEPTDLSKIGFDNGASGKEYAAQPRVKTVEVSYFDKEKTRTLKERISVGDTDKLQPFDLDGKEVYTVVIKIVEVYPGQKGNAASLREIVFWQVK